MATKKEIQAAKKTVKERLGETDAAVGLTTDPDGNPAIAVRFTKKPTKKFLKSLAADLAISVISEVIGVVSALPKKKKTTKKSAKKTTAKTVSFKISRAKIKNDKFHQSVIVKTT